MVMRELMGSLLAFMVVQIAGWAMAHEEVALQTMIANHGRGARRPKKWSALVRASVNLQRRPQLATAEQAKGKTMNLSTSGNIARGNSLYISAASQCFQQCRVFELVLDSSPFGSKNFELACIFSPDINKAAWVAPVEVRSLLWRMESAGAPMSEENWKARANMNK